MAQISKIEWTDTTWNPTVGCTPVSAGCGNCYAVRMAYRQEMMKPSSAYKGLTVIQSNGKRGWTGEVRCLPERLKEPLGWKTPRRIFVGSMSDLFHEDVPFEFLDQVFAVMALCPQHIFQLLTKRPERMAEYMNRPGFPNQTAFGTVVFVNALRLGLKNAEDYRRFYERPWPLPNVWMGTSVEDQKAADARIPHLVSVPAAVRFLSCEPLLAAVDLVGGAKFMGPMRDAHKFGDWRIRAIDSISWVIVGGESGPGARPFCIDWARRIVAQCNRRNVPVFVKQLGSFPCLSYYSEIDDDVVAAHYTGKGVWEPVPGKQGQYTAWDFRKDNYQPRPGTLMQMSLKDRKGGDIDEWPTDLRVRQFPQTTAGGAT